FEVPPAVPDRYIGRCGPVALEPFEEIAGTPHLHAREPGQVCQTATGFDHLDRRTTPAVTVTKRNEQLLLQQAVLEPVPCPASDAGQERAVVGGVPAGPQR